MIYEIRNYHFEPSRFEEYKAWARDRALPYLKANLDLVDFWTSVDAPSEVNGKPMDELGSANITWVIRWPDQASRDAAMATIFTGDEWGEIFATVPGGMDSYIRMESKYAESLM